MYRTDMIIILVCIFAKFTIFLLIFKFKLKIGIFRV